jgi:hypothetical protein
VGDVANGSARPAVARSLGDGRIGIWVHFDDKDEAKALPGSRWAKGLKCWTVPSIFRAEAEHLVAALNARTARRPGASDTAGLTVAFKSLFVALAEPLRRPVHRALARTLHPDHGGDADAMRALNDACGDGGGS